MPRGITGLETVKNEWSYTSAPTPVYIRLTVSSPVMPHGITGLETVKNEWSYTSAPHPGIFSRLGQGKLITFILREM
jgi:hypothetical protein